MPYMKYTIWVLLSVIYISTFGQNTHQPQKGHAYFGYHPLGRDTLYLTYSQIEAAPFLRCDLGSIEEFYVMWTVYGGDAATPILVKGNALPAPVLSALRHNKNRRTTIYMGDIRLKEKDGLMRVLNPVTIEMASER